MAFKATVLNYDPYRNFKFLIKWDNKVVAAVSKISALSKSIDVVDWRAGGDNNSTAKLPGHTKYEPITLERGLSADPEFVNWMNLVNTYQTLGGTSAEHNHAFRKDLEIEVYNLANEKVLAATVRRAWPSKLVAVPDLDAKANEVAIEKLELQNEGWFISERPDGVPDPG